MIEMRIGAHRRHRRVEIAGELGRDMLLENIDHLLWRHVTPHLDPRYHSRRPDRKQPGHLSSGKLTY
jgi:hypothetical protein